MRTDETAITDDGCSSGWCTALLWIVPAKVAGTWSTRDGELKLTQQFQMISGTLGTSAVHGRLRGDEITFTAGARKYVGKVDGNVIKGALPRAWTATKKR